MLTIKLSLAFKYASGYVHRWFIMNLPLSTILYSLFIALIHCSACGYSVLFAACIQDFSVFSFTLHSNNCSCQLRWSWYSHKWPTQSLQYNLQLCSDLHLWCRLHTAGIKQQNLPVWWTVEWECATVQSYAGCHVWCTCNMETLTFQCFSLSAVCTSPCQNGGTCTAPDTCTCDVGWTGMQCEAGVW